MKITLKFLLLAVFSTSLPLFAESESDNGVSENYILRPTDLIRMEIFQEPELEQELRVSADGAITLPLIGTIQVGGLTVLQAQERITQLYDKDYLVEPHVSLLVLVYTERRVEVLGMVNRPGKVPIPPEEDMTLTKAISGAGGHNRLADLSRVRLTRTDESGKPKVMRINFSEISRGKAADIKLQDGDSIFVEERIF